MFFSSVEMKIMSISFFYLLKLDKCFDGGLKWTNTNFAAESGTGCRNLGAEIVQFFRALPPETALVPISLVGFSDICNCACSRVQKYFLHKTKQTNKSLPKRKVHEQRQLQHLELESIQRKSFKNWFDFMLPQTFTQTQISEEIFSETQQLPFLRLAKLLKTFCCGWNLELFCRLMSDVKFVWHHTIP